MAEEVAPGIFASERPGEALEEYDNLRDLLPGVETQRANLQWLLEYYATRNAYIEEQRRSVEGLQPIDFPVSTQYSAQVVHMYSQTAMVNEKVSRYLHQPTWSSLIEDPSDEEELERLTRVENWLNIATYEIERLGDGDAYDRAIFDTHLLDMGVYKLVCAPNPLWKEVVLSDKQGDGRYPMQSKERTQYKKEHGVPIKRQYVPLEFWLPGYDGPRLDYSFEIEARTLFSATRNPLFDKDVIERLAYQSTVDGKNMILPLIHYCDDEFYAVYAMRPLSGTIINFKLNSLSVTPLELLYATRHYAGRNFYVPIAGRYGGWKTQNNRIEGVNKGIMSLSDRIDQLMSQIITNIRAKYWPNLKFKVDPNLRGLSPGQEIDPPSLQEGKPVVILATEELEPIFTPQDDPMAQWALLQLIQAMEKLGGSSALYGMKMPGVDSGYLNAQSIDQAQHLEEKTEQHIIQSAIEDATIVLNYIKNIGEEVWAVYPQEEPITGRKLARYLAISDKDLNPMPRIDAQVRKADKIDFVAAVRTAKDASDEREGKGPLFSTLTNRTEIMGMTAARASREEYLVRTEAQKNKLWNSDFINEQVAQALGLKLAQKGVPQMSQQTVQGASPAFQQAVQGFANSPAGQTGGVNPQTLAHINNGPATRITSNHTGGRAVTDSQPEARVGEAVSAATGGKA